MKALLEFGGLKMDELVGSRSVLQGHRMGVTLQFKDKFVNPFLNEVDCFVHKTNLALVTLSNMELVH